MLGQQQGETVDLLDLSVVCNMKNLVNPVQLSGSDGGVVGLQRSDFTHS